ncbi:CHASE2 domain-containing protein [Pseudoxanthomonas kalamensis]|uniref:CHASE2 domain-containing protein n=1 Tax=Pseudoxanthomonas kalamensis TaxID=289483 RepID=UPI0013912393|nr:CHASE2 domain-containing protein [Pseudoxanthomonas kalamensis]
MSAPRPLAARIRSRLLTALGASAIAVLLIGFDPAWRVDAWFYDHFSRHLVHEADPAVVVIAIDEKSLAELGRWPWSRRVHARLIDRLGDIGVRGIGLNLLLSEPALYDPEGDALLARALERSGKVVLPVYAEEEYSNGPSVELLPIPEFSATAAALGHVDQSADSDGITRSMYLRAGLGSAHWPSLALALAQLDKPELAGDSSLPGEQLGELPEDGLVPHRWVRNNRVLMPYLDPPDGFPEASYADVLNGRIAEPMLRNRLILIGMTASGMGDGLVPPGRGARLSGVEYQANALNMLLQGKAISPLGLPARVALSLLLICLPLALLGLPGMRKLWQPLLLGIALALLLSLLLLHLAHAWFAPTAVLLVLLLGLLLWLLHALRHTYHRAQSDALTGLANRIRFNEALEQELRVARRSKQPLSLLLLDIDYFKQLNDSRGHAMGDRVLHALAATLQNRARRPRDLIARLGGDEFAVLLPETSAQAAAAIATTLHVDLANLPGKREGDLPMAARFTVSIGIHTSDSAEETVAEMMERTDSALYQAKQLGRNRSFTYGNDLAT